MIRSRRRQRNINLIESKINSSAIIPESVLLGKNVTIGANVEIGENVIIKDDVTIGSASVIEDGSFLPKGLYLYPGSIYGADKKRALAVQKVMDKYDTINKRGISKFANKFKIDQEEMADFRLKYYNSFKLNQHFYTVRVKNADGKVRRTEGFISAKGTLMIDSRDSDGGIWPYMVNNVSSPTRARNPISPEGLKIQKLMYVELSDIPVATLLTNDSGKIPNSVYFEFLDTITLIKRGLNPRFN